MAALIPAQAAQAQGFVVSHGEAHAAPDIGGIRTHLRGVAMSACGVRYHLAPRRQPPNLLVVEISTSLVVGGPGCNFVPVTLHWRVPFANLEDGQYEVVVLYTNPPVPLEMPRFTVGMPVAVAVPMGSWWTWILLFLVLVALAYRHRIRAKAV